MSAAVPTLLVMRHGPAADQSVTGLDDDRILTAAGRARVERMAEALVKNGAIPAVVVTSPLARAAETATILLRVLRKHGHQPSLEIGTELAPGRFTVASAPGLLARHPGLVCVVGHEPCLSAFVERACSTSLPRGMDKAMIVALANALPRASIAWVLDPMDHGG